MGSIWTQLSVVITVSEAMGFEKKYELPEEISRYLSHYR